MRLLPVLRSLRWAERSLPLEIIARLDAYAVWLWLSFRFVFVLLLLIAERVVVMVGAATAAAPAVFRKPRTRRRLYLSTSCSVLLLLPTGTKQDIPDCITPLVSCVMSVVTCITCMPLSCEDPSSQATYNKHKQDNPQGTSS